MRALLLVLLLIAITAPAQARDPGGKWAAEDPQIHAWFDQLASKKGLCCSFADGVKVEAPDYGTERVAIAGEDQVRYWVKLDGEKIVVPPEALVTEPNKFGQAVVWPYKDADGVTQIRCFMPGAGA